LPTTFMYPIAINTTWPPWPLPSVVPWGGVIGFPPTGVGTNQVAVLVLCRNGHCCLTSPYRTWSDRIPSLFPAPCLNKNSVSKLHHSNCNNHMMCILDHFLLLLFDWSWICIRCLASMTLN
jgi:hypothetical protein